MKLPFINSNRKYKAGIVVADIIYKDNKCQFIGLHYKICSFNFGQK